MNPSSARPRREILTKSALITAAIFLLAGWLWFTPSGLLGKADAVGYAVCHRIAVRSFFFGERQFPLCSRCSGMYLGALAGMLYHLNSRQRAGLPAPKITAALAAFAVLFAIDGVNSYLHFLPGNQGLYQPHNWLRLLTGTGVGLGISAALIPVVRQTLWADWEPKPVLHSWKQLGVLALLGGVVDMAILSENPLILYPLALLSTGTILAILTLVYAVVWVMITKRENAFKSWRGAWMVLVAGFSTALVQISLLDTARYALTHTWEGFNLALH